MFPTRRTLVPLLATVLLSAALAGCHSPEDPDVLGTFYPMTFLAEEIAGDLVTVGQILKPGTEPHHWEPTVRDMARIGGAHLVVAQGLDFEPWLERLITNLGTDAPHVLEVAESIGRLPDVGDHDDDHEEDDDGDHDQDGHDDHGDVDPHTWLDPSLMARKVAVVEEALSAAFPEHAETFRANAAQLIERLDALDAAYASRLAVCETRHIVVQHNAFAYPAARYGFEVHAASGLSPDAEPDARTIARIIEETREHDLGVVFTETLANPQVMQTIAQETGAEVRVLSPLELRSPEETRAGLDYVDLMERNLDELAFAMRCNAD